MMTDIVWCIWIFEVFGYYGHRILHTRSLYKYHKVEATHRAALSSLYIAGSPRLASSHRGRHLVRSPCGRSAGGHSAHRPRAPPDGLPRQHHLGVVPRHQLPHHHGPLRLPPPPAEVKRGSRVPPPGSKHGSGDWQLITLHLQAGHGNYGNWGRVMDTVHGTDQRFLSSIEHSRDRRLLGLTPVNRTTKAEQD